MAPGDTPDLELDTGRSADSQSTDDAPLTQLSARAIEMEPLIHVEHEESEQAVRTCKPALRRYALASVGLLLIAGVCLAALHARPFGGVAIQVPVSSGYISLNAVEIDESFLEHPEICAPTIVEKACMRLNQETTEHYGNTRDRDLRVVHATELQEVFMVERKSLIAALTKMRVANIAQDRRDPNEYAMKCSDLCAATAGSFNKGTLPAKSNVACHKQGWWIFSRTICDIDVSHSALAAINKFYDLWGPGKGAEPKFVTPDSDPDWGGIQFLVNDEEDGTPENEDPDVKKAIDRLNYPPRDFEDLALDIANYFEIFPPVKATASISGGPVTDVQGRRLQSSDWERNALVYAQTARSFISKALQALNSQQIPHVVKEWYGVNDQTTRAEVKRVLIGVSNMLGNVQYVYPGSYCEPNYYAYVFPNPSVDEYGQRVDRNTRTGQYIFFLCDYYFKTDDTGRIETLLHEGSHHLTMALDDSQYYYWTPTGSCSTTLCTLYGQSACLETANRCAQGDTTACQRAVRNADSFGYFVSAAEQEAGKLSQSPGADSANEALDQDDHWDRTHGAVNEGSSFR